MMTKLGSREHFQQVINAHIVSPWSEFCRCGARVTDYRAHIKEVWRPHSLPEGWLA